jgi:hypothetical protein
MANLGGRFLLEQPIQFNGGVVLIGDKQSNVDVNSADIVALGNLIVIEASVINSCVIGHNHAVDQSSSDVVLLGHSNNVTTVSGDPCSFVVAIGSTNVIRGPNVNNFPIPMAIVCIGDTNTLVGPDLDHVVTVGSGNTVTSMARTTVVGHFNSIVPSAGSADSVIIGNYNSGELGLSFVIGYRITLPFGSGSIIAIGAGITVGAGKGGLGGIIIGNGATLTSNSATGIAIGPGASAGNHQCVIGLTEPTAASAAIHQSIHQFIVRGLTGSGPFTAIDTLNAIDNPAAGESGLTVVYNASGTFTNKTLKAALSPPSGSLLAYFTP